MSILVPPSCLRSRLNRRHDLLAGGLVKSLLDESHAIQLQRACQLGMRRRVLMCDDGGLISVSEPGSWPGGAGGIAGNRRRSSPNACTHSGRPPLLPIGNARCSLRERRKFQVAWLTFAESRHAWIGLQIARDQKGRWWHDQPQRDARGGANVRAPHGSSGHPTLDERHLAQLVARATQRLVDVKGGDEGGGCRGRAKANGECILDGKVHIIWAQRIDLATEHLLTLGVHD